MDVPFGKSMGFVSHWQLDWHEVVQKTTELSFSYSYQTLKLTVFRKISLPLQPIH